MNVDDALLKNLRRRMAIRSFLLNLRCKVIGHRWHQRFAGGYLCHRCLTFEWSKKDLRKR